MPPTNIAAELAAKLAAVPYSRSSFVDWQPRRPMGEPYRGHLYKQRDGSLSFTAFVSFSTRHGRHFLRVEFDPAFLQYGYFNPMWDGASEFLAGDLIAMHR